MTTFGYVAITRSYSGYASATGPTVVKEWDKTYGGAGPDCAWLVHQTQDGGYVIAGALGSAVPGGPWLFETDATGTVEWSRAYGDKGYGPVDYADVTADGGVIAVGSIDYGSDVGICTWLMKLDSGRNIEWNRTYRQNSMKGEYNGKTVQQTSDGGYIIAGNSKVYGVSDYDLWVIKTDSIGNVLLNRTYGGSAADRAWCVREAADGGYVIAGETASYGAGDYDAWLVKLDLDGNMQWNRTYGWGDFDQSHSVEQTSDGGYVVAFYSGNTGDYMASVVKTDSEGLVEWTRTYGGHGVAGTYIARPTLDGGYALVGTKNTAETQGDDLWLVKLDPNGDVQWETTYGGSLDDRGYGFAQTTDGGYALIGLTYSFGAGGRDAWLIKVHAVPSDSGLPPSDSGPPNTSISVANPVVIMSLLAVLVLFALLAIRRRKRNGEDIGEAYVHLERGVAFGRRRAVSPKKHIIATPASHNCPYCGARTELPDALFCWNCGASIERRSEGVLVPREGKRAAVKGKCMVCNLDIRNSDTVAWCPYCGNMAHRAHILEWLHVKNQCPVCDKKLNNEDLLL